MKVDEKSMSLFKETGVDMNETSVIALDKIL